MVLGQQVLLDLKEDLGQQDGQVLLDLRVTLVGLVNKVDQVRLDLLDHKDLREVQDSQGGLVHKVAQAQLVSQDPQAQQATLVFKVLQVGPDLKDLRV